MPLKPFSQPRIESATKSRVLSIFLLIFLGGASYLLTVVGVLHPENVFAYLEAHWIMAPVLFLFIFFLMTISLIPTLPLNLGAGFLWGPVWGSILSITGAAIGACCSFLISRHIAADYCRSRFRNPLWVWLSREVELKSWKAVAFVRMNPAFSTGALNYFFGLTPIPFRTYCWSTVVFLTPPSTLIAAIGHLVGWGALSGEGIDLFRDATIIAAAGTGILILIFAIRVWFKQVKKTHICPR